MPDILYSVVGQEEGISVWLRREEADQVVMTPTQVAYFIRDLSQALIHHEERK